ncbi:signal peptidase II [Sodalis sp. CWE]|uniref:signal peptidase II n=1 Tax=Sodalis sp. CWE TaxID=2803816 RepID=UPI001C7E0A9E|nr:signal peptidase II [Sodalis sp. CWE]MBX4180723.1 signal peptidase II [Sodalis sp. CWE]
MYYINFLVMVMLDLISKKWIMTHLWIGESISVFPFISFTYVLNSGIIFGFLAGKGETQRWILSIISIMVLLILFIIVQSNKSKRLSSIAYTMIASGAFGNLFDRVMYGFVIDFIDFHIDDWHWPTFNLADTEICIGIILITLENIIVRYNNR